MQTPTETPCTCGTTIQSIVTCKNTKCLKLLQTPRERRQKRSSYSITPRYSDSPEVKDYPNGLRIAVQIKDDFDFGAPWDNFDGHGPVREGNGRGDKRPGERILSSYQSKTWFYDWSEAMRIAKRDWVSKDGEGTIGQRAEKAVQKDFEYLEGFLREQWSYIGVDVTLYHVTEDGDETELDRDSVWGIEYGLDSMEAYPNELAREMAASLLSKHRNAIKPQPPAFILDDPEGFPGRVIYDRNGNGLLTIERYEEPPMPKNSYSTGHCNLQPHETDEYAARIVELLNRYGMEG